MITVLHFIEDNVPAGDNPFETEVLVLTNENISQDILEEIKTLKEAADETGEFIGLENPSDWEDYGWHEKIQIVCEYVASKKGFKILPKEINTIFVN